MLKNKLIMNSNELEKILGKRKNLSKIFNDKFGIVNALLERNELKKYNLYMYQCLSANTTELFLSDREVSSGGLGISEKKEQAITSCLAESLERYCMSFIPKKEIIKSYKDDLDKKHIFSNFYTYTEEQYNKYPFLNPNKEMVDWTKIKSYTNKSKYKYWPASLIYLPYPKNNIVAETTSTGMAAGIKLSDCVLSGLLENIERDALMINFMKRLNPPLIDLNSIKGKNRSFIDKIAKEYKIAVYKLYSDIKIPIYLSIIYKKTFKGIHYGIGACASLDSDYAINKALKECLFTYFYSKNILDVKQNDENKIKTLYEHFLYYQGNNFGKLLFKDSKTIKYKKEKYSFKELLNMIKANNLEVYYKELTTSDIKETGIKVVKVIVPGLIDLNKSHIYPRLGATRFEEVPKKLGIIADENLTKLPHPFP